MVPLLIARQVAEPSEIEAPEGEDSTRLPNGFSRRYMRYTATSPGRGRCPRRWAAGRRQLRSLSPPFTGESVLAVRRWEVRPTPATAPTPTPARPRPGGVQRRNRNETWGGPSELSGARQAARCLYDAGEPSWARCRCYSSARQPIQYTACVGLLHLFQKVKVQKK